MPRKKKHFIDNSTAIKFSLVHRDQRDPLIAQDGAERVLVEMATKQGHSKDRTFEIDPKELKVEQQKFGIYFDDDYNYLQHLRSADEVVSWEPVNSRYRISADGRVTDAGTDLLTDDKKDEVPKLRLPSSIFASQNDELKTGLLNQAAPRPGPHPELDPDILAALDDDFDFENPENVLDDDFVVKANEKVEGQEEVLENVMEEEEGEGFDSEDESGDEFELEETKSRFTQYSMTSSVMRRSQGLKHIDDMFEKMYEQYDEEEMGGIDVEEAEDMGGFIEPDSDRLNEIVHEYMRKKEERHHVMDVIDEKDERFDVAESSGEEGRDQEEMVQQGADRWDCETILTTYSTLYNHPTLIDDRPADRRIKVDRRRGLPVEGIGGQGLTEGRLKKLDGNDVQGTRSIRSTVSTVRDKNETAEQKKLRKHVVKMERRERREERKANKTAFKIEDHRINTEKINKMMNKGMKLV